MKSKHQKKDEKEVEKSKEQEEEGSKKTEKAKLESQEEQFKKAGDTRENSSKKTKNIQEKDLNKDKLKPQRLFNVPPHHVVELRPIADLKPVEHTDLTNLRKKLLSHLPKADKDKRETKPKNQSWADIMDED